MQDRLHQAHRQVLVPGLAEALATPRMDGLLGLALSGAGPSVIALSHDFDEKIDHAIQDRFRQNGTEATVRYLAIDHEGVRSEARL